MTPQSFGKYLVTDLLGSGGMAEVYAGIHPDLERRVAIKVILPQFATESNFEERFRREARMVASLRHPYIVQLYDFDVVDGRHFMVMEHLDGGTLKEYLRSFSQRKTTIPLAEAAHLIEAMASALDYAHGRGAVHRDIKPANILFTATREAVLTDFGIAKILEDAVRLTVTGGVVGSPFYMSPEQATGGDVDARSDQYSLGVVLYEMATGRAPFLGSSAVAVMTQHLNNTPPLPRSLNASLPATVDAVLLKVLSKRPGDRFSSAGELAHAFREAVEGRGSVVIPAPAANDEDRTLISGAQTPADGEATMVSAATDPIQRGQTPPPAEEAATVVAGRPEAVAPPPVQPASRPASHSAPAQPGSPRAEPRPEHPEPKPRQAESEPAQPVSQPPVPQDRAALPAANKQTPEHSDDRALPAAPATPTPKPTNQNFHVGGIQAGVVNQGGEQTFSGDLTFNLDFGDIKASPPQQEAPAKAAATGSEEELAVILETLRRAFAGSSRVERFVRMVTQFNDQLEALPPERVNDRKQVVKRVQALLLEMTEAQPDPDMVEIMGASLQKAVQPLALVDPDLPTMVTRITSWVELMVEPE
jgi:serine/threonine protein kinase